MILCMPIYAGSRAFFAVAVPIRSYTGCDNKLRSPGLEEVQRNGESETASSCPESMSQMSGHHHEPQVRPATAEPATTLIKKKALL
jgi:hypothetical protein